MTEDETMMQCQDIDELMVEFLYQEIEGEQLVAFQKHVDGCARCGAEMKSLVRTRQALRALPEAEPSAAVSARLLHEAAKRRAKEAGGGIVGWFIKLFGPIAAHPAWAAAASVILIAGVAGFLSIRANVDGQVRHAESSAPVAAAPASTVVPEASTAKPEVASPRDVFVRGGDVPRDVAPASDSSAAPGNGYASKDVRALDEKTPPPPPRKVAAPAVVSVPVNKQGKRDLGTVADNDDRYGRTASADEDQKLAEPAKPQPKSLGTRRKAEAMAPDPSEGRSDVGGIVAVPPPPPASPPAAEPASADGSVATGRSTAQAQREAESARQRAGAVYKAKSGALSPSEPSKAPSAAGPPAAAPASTTTYRAEAAKESKDLPSAPPAEQDRSAPAQTSTPAKAAAKLPPEQELLQIAQKQATTGRCTEALGTRDRIARMNPEFYRRRVVGDASLRGCEETNRKNRAPARAVKSAAEEAADSKAVTK